MRFVVAIVGGIVAVIVVTLLAAGIYALFPDSDDVIEVTPIALDDLVLDEDYTIEGLQCECQSEEIEFDIEQTESGLGCKRRILSKTQRQSLPICRLKKHQNT